ncbi:MAG: DinB family protein [Acidobacteria bacterium]|nr:DinB family protein [Acidobacteriota bacterium]
MYTAAVLTDIHARAHESFRRLIAYCGTLPGPNLVTPVPGFGFPTILKQFEHTIAAELYWQTVLIRGYHEEATLPDVSTLAAIEAFRQHVAATTRTYLSGASEAELNTCREMTSDPGITRVLKPADVILRIVTHVFNHQGQILAMCRVLGKPNETVDVDYPIDPFE